MTKNYLILPVLIIAIIMFVIGSMASAQNAKQVIIKKECISTTQSGDSIQVIIKTIGDCNNSDLLNDSIYQTITTKINDKDGVVKIIKVTNRVTSTKKNIIDSEYGDSTKVIIKSIGNCTNTDSLIQTICTEIDSENGAIKIVKIINDDTVISEFGIDSLSHLFMDKLHNESFYTIITELENHVNLMDSTGNFAFNVVFDPINWNDKKVEVLENVDSVVVKTINVEVKDGKSMKQFIVIADDGENIRIEKEGEIVFINKEDCIKNIYSDIEMVQEKNGEKVLVLQTRIVLEDFSDSESKTLKSNGIKTNSKTPEFDYIKFFPNPSKENINIQFKLAKKGDIKLRISNMLGQEIFSDNLHNYEGEYKRNVNLKQHGEGTYILQIIQGKRSITRKIIVE